MKHTAIRPTGGRLLAYAFSCILLAPSALQADGHRNGLLAAGAQQQIGVLVEYFEVDHASLPAQLRMYQAESDGSKLLERIRAMAQAGKARLVESGYIVTRSGQRAKIESILELIYPTEYDPPEVPQKLVGPIAPEAVIATAANPTAFEMRPVGFTLEVEPTTSPEGDIVELQVAPERVEFMGMEKWGENFATTHQPIFHSMRVNAAITLKVGGSELLGVFTPRLALDGGGDGKRVLGFVSAMGMLVMDAETYEKAADAPPVPEKVEPQAKPFAGGEDEDDPFGGDGDDPEESGRAQKQVSLLAEFIEVDAALAGEFARGLNEISDATALRMKLDGLIAEGDAKVLETTSILTRSGMRASVGSHKEYIYPTEYDPAEVPAELIGPLAAGLEFRTSAGPTAFEMRNLGVSVEAEPTLSHDGGLVNLNIAPEIVRLVGLKNYGSGANTVSQPLFETIKLFTAVTIPAGTSVLLGMHSLETARAGESAGPDEQAAVRDRRVLVFVTAGVKTVK